MDWHLSLCKCSIGYLCTGSINMRIIGWVRVLLLTVHSVHLFEWEDAEVVYMCRERSGCTGGLTHMFIFASPFILLEQCKSWSVNGLGVGWMSSDLQSKLIPEATLDSPAAHHVDNLPKWMWHLYGMKAVAQDETWYYMSTLILSKWCFPLNGVLKDTRTVGLT
jgi:hypothetical protein